MPVEGDTNTFAVEENILSIKKNTRKTAKKAAAETRVAAKKI